jgi:hypothetical protein
LKPSANVKFTALVKSALVRSKEIAFLVKFLNKVRNTVSTLGHPLIILLELTQICRRRAKSLQKFSLKRFPRIQLSGWRILLAIKPLTSSRRGRQRLRRKREFFLSELVTVTKTKQIVNTLVAQNQEAAKRRSAFRTSNVSSFNDSRGKSNAFTTAREVPA